MRPVRLAVGLAVTLAISAPSATHAASLSLRFHGSGVVLKHANGNLAELASFFAYTPSFTGGVFVGTGHVLCGVAAQVLTGAGPGGGPHVRAFTGGGLDAGVSFFAYVPGFTGGVRIAAGPVEAAAADRIVTAPSPGGGPHVRILDAAGAPAGVEFLAY